MKPPADALTHQWRAEADVLDANGATVQALVKRRCADELDVWFRDWWLEVLTVPQAARERGESYQATWRRVHRGDIPNVGHCGAPRIRRCDLWAGAGLRAE